MTHAMKDYNKPRGWLARMDVTPKLFMNSNPWQAVVSKLK